MKLVAVFRQPHGLTALVSRRKPEADLSTLFAADEDAELTAGVFEIVELPMDDVPASLCPQRLAILTAWEALRAVQSPGATVLNHVLTILQETAMCEDSALDLPALILQTRRPPSSRRRRTRAPSKGQPTVRPNRNRSPPLICAHTSVRRAARRPCLTGWWTSRPEPCALPRRMLTGSSVCRPCFAPHYFQGSERVAVPKPMPSSRSTGGWSWKQVRPCSPPLPACSACVKTPGLGWI